MFSIWWVIPPVESFPFASKIKQPKGKIAHWLQKLQEYHFNIMHHPGKQHSNVDAMSRIPCHQCGQLPHEVNQLLVICNVQISDLSLSVCSPTKLWASYVASRSCHWIKLTESKEKPQVSTKTVRPACCQGRCDISSVCGSS